MKSLTHQILVLDAMIGSLRFLRSGAASAELAAVAVERERELMKERDQLADLQRRQGDLNLGEDRDAA